MSKKTAFTKTLVNFYVEFYNGLENSINILSKIQKKYKSEYKELKKIQNQSTEIYNLIDRFDEEDKKIILDLLLRANLLQAKISKLFDLSVKEQEKLSKEIGEYTRTFKRTYNRNNEKI